MHRNWWNARSTGIIGRPFCCSSSKNHLDSALILFYWRHCFLVQNIPNSNIDLFRKVVTSGPGGSENEETRALAESNKDKLRNKDVGVRSTLSTKSLIVEVDPNSQSTLMPLHRRVFVICASYWLQGIEIVWDRKISGKPLKIWAKMFKVLGLIAKPFGHWFKQMCHHQIERQKLWRHGEDCLEIRRS